MIFAAGLGTRLKPLTDTMPKALVPLSDKPLIQWQIEKLVAYGITDIVVNVHHFPDQIIDFLHSRDWGASIAVSDERDVLLETGGGLYKAMATYGANEPWLICNVDILSNLNLDHVMAAYNPDELGVVVVSQRDTQRYLCFDDSLRLCGWTNVATGELRHQDGTHLAFSGFSILSPQALPLLEHFAKEQGEKFSLIDFYLQVCNTQTLRAYIPNQYRIMDVGKIDQLSDAERFAASLQHGE